MSIRSTDSGYIAVGILLIAITINTIARWPPFECYFEIASALTPMICIGIPIVILYGNKVIRYMLYWGWWLMLGNLIDEITKRALFCSTTELVYAVIVTIAFLFLITKEITSRSRKTI